MIEVRPLGNAQAHEVHANHTGGVLDLARRKP
jgi:hypothetical protein